MLLRRHILPVEQKKYADETSIVSSINSENGFFIRVKHMPNFEKILSGSNPPDPLTDQDETWYVRAHVQA